MATTKVRVNNAIRCCLAIGPLKKSANGDLYNDMPDRFADALFIIPVGYVAGGFGVELGWLGALLAVMTAYFRWIGAYKTHQHFFNGPMAKQHRMALLTLTFVVATCTIHSGYDRMVCFIALIIINIGLIATLIHRLYLMSHTTNTESNEREKGKEEIRDVIADKYSTDKHTRHDPP